MRQQQQQNTDLPDGFVFGYNNRRGDPLFDTYWYLEYNGKEIGRFFEGLKYPNEEAARSAASVLASRIADKKDNG